MAFVMVILLLLLFFGWFFLIFLKPQTWVENQVIGKRLRSNQFLYRRIHFFLFLLLSLVSDVGNLWRLSLSFGATIWSCHLRRRMGTGFIFSLIYKLKKDRYFTCRLPTAKWYVASPLCNFLSVRGQTVIVILPLLKSVSCSDLLV